MENRTEFNLENNIQNWKSILTKKNNLTKSNIIELENHLLDLIEELESKGLNKEESFLIAKKRIGKIDDICLEFDKVNNNFSFINKLTPYLKGALIYITFIIFSKLFLVIPILLSQKFSINLNAFTPYLILLILASISFYSILYFNFKHKKSFLSKLNNVNVLVPLIIISYLITYRFWAQVTLPGINPSELLGNHPTSLDFYIMEENFNIYKMLSGIILLITSLIFFWRNKKYNKLKHTK